MLDFGLSRFSGATSSNVTRTGIVMGTPSYMAPEQARGERVDFRADVYGVGAILYCALTGRPPFEEESAHQTVLAVMTGEPIRPRLLVPEIPEELELVVQRAMASAPDERFQSMEELDAALERFGLERFDPRAAASRNAPRQLPSRGASMTDDSEVGSARPQVLAFACLALLLGVLGLIVTVSELPELLGRRPLTAFEFWLVLAVVVGTLLTPFVLLVRWFRRRYWNNSVKMVELLPRLRGPVLGAAAALGVVALGGRAADAIRARSSGGSSGGEVAAWSGWGPIACAVASLVALAVLVRRRYLQPGAGGARRWLAGPVLTAGTLVAALFLLRFGYAARQQPSVVPLAAGSASNSAPASAASAPRLPPASAGVIQSAKASPDEVRKATAAGRDALLALAKRHPEDPNVLEPLVLALGTEAAGLPRAMQELEVLFSVDPSKVASANLSSLVVKAALTPGEASTRALDLMGSRMGTLGPDMLYDLMLTSPHLRQAARERLDDPATQQRFSPGLSIAFSLRTAKSCSDRKPLLPRVLSDGDARSVSALMAVATGPKKGCGRHKKRPCPPACPAEAAAFKATALKLQAKLHAQK